MNPKPLDSLNHLTLPSNMKVQASLACAHRHALCTFKKKAASVAAPSVTSKQRRPARISLPHRRSRVNATLSWVVGQFGQQEPEGRVLVAESLDDPPDEGAADGTEDEDGRIGLGDYRVC